MFYSPSLNIFVNPVLKDEYLDSDTWPDDAIAVSVEIYSEFTGEAPAGKIRITGSDGLPAWGDIPPPTHEQLVVVAELKKAELLAAAEMTISIWQTKLLLGIISDKDKASLIAWLAYIDDLNTIDTDTAPDISWPEPPAA
ncbi:tail fiber assembly protein [Escherichia coli]|uniref:tail fiber assembly protein n=1 Tax=Escherichia coli TaxID=562 RepID=UPI0017D61436|nr:tail fiber assembly protein [Escherichia coli]EFE7690259.1 tail fiber assembly protein [Escherichia coli]MBL7291408.1 tail fiber assembly protein [Escherichia coli]QSC56035.1 tail fiber assembly protein [Escherichia coli]HAW0944865.1 tail fiber assembly protein [Escherichia coli]HAW0963017.1 tail fiber assembly protein [Escherichia coli]